MMQFRIQGNRHRLNCAFISFSDQGAQFLLMTENAGKGNNRVRRSTVIAKTCTVSPQSSGVREAFILL